MPMMRLVARSCFHTRMALHDNVVVAAAAAVIASMKACLRRKA